MLNLSDIYAENNEKQQPYIVNQNYNQELEN